MRVSILLISLLISPWAFASEGDSLALPDFSFVADLYYALDDPRNDQHERPAFLYNHSRTGELALNHAAFRVRWDRRDIRSTIALMAGTYAQRNLAAELPGWRFVQEAHAGIRVGTSTWIDAGILPSHIGMESVADLSNLTLTRTLAADNSPYFETGARVSHARPGSPWSFAFLVLNGWQRIQLPEGHFYPSFGTQVSYRTNRLLANASHYVGDEDPRKGYGTRFFQNLYLRWASGSRWTVAASLDNGVQYSAERGDTPSYWWTAFLILSCEVHEKASLVARAEVYSDTDAVILPTATTDGAGMLAYSAGFTLELSAGAQFRMEARRIDAGTPTFATEGSAPDRYYTAGTANLLIHF